MYIIYRIAAIYFIAMTAAAAANAYEYSFKIQTKDTDNTIYRQKIQIIQYKKYNTAAFGQHCKIEKRYKINVYLRMHCYDGEGITTCIHVKNEYVLLHLCNHTKLSKEPQTVILCVCAFMDVMNIVV